MKKANFYLILMPVFAGLWWLDHLTNNKLLGINGKIIYFIWYPFFLKIELRCSFLSWVIKLSLAALSRNIFTKWRRYANKNERSKSAITKRFGTLSSSSAAGWNKKATIFFLRKSPTCTNFVAARDKFFLFVSAEFFKGVLLGQPSYRGRPTVSAIGFAQPSLCWRRSYCFNPFVYFILFPICYLAAESLPVWG